MTSRDGRAQRAVALAEELLRDARAEQTADELAQARKLARMMADPHGKELTIALLGEAEAARRLAAYLALLARDDVEYISVKVSSIFSQIDLIAFGDTVDRVKDRLRALYRQALGHEYRHPDGRITPKFINLDMEE